MSPSDATGRRGTPRAIPFGKYILLERLYSGRSAEVFLAKTFGVEGFQRFVALKRMRTRAAQDDVAVARFVDEAKLGGALSHACIAPVYELGKVRDLHYTAMEHVWGQSLATLVARRSQRPVPAAFAAFTGAKVFEALHHAHSRRTDGSVQPVFHGNMEPGNILISYEGAVKLIGFRGREGGDDDDALLDGRYAYRSPEQVGGGRVDARTDLFGAAACIYQLLTGKGPEDTAHPHTPENDELARRVEEILVTCMERRPTDRPESAALVRSELMAALSAGQPFTTSRVAEWMRNEFDETIERSKRRLNLYASVRSSEEMESLRAIGTEDDPFADEPTIITEAPIEDRGVVWDDAETQIYFSSEGWATGEHSSSFLLTSEASGSIELSQEALVPDGASDPDVPHEAPARVTSRPPARRRSKRQRQVRWLWYAALVAAVVCVGIVVMAWITRGSTGSLEVRERSGHEAQVFLDGQEQGEAPIRLENLRPGQHVVELREGEDRSVHVVRVRPGVTALIELSLPRADEDSDAP